MQVQTQWANAGDDEKRITVGDAIKTIWAEEPVRRSNVIFQEPTPSVHAIQENVVIENNVPMPRITPFRRRANNLKHPTKYQLGLKKAQETASNDNS